MTAAVRRRRNGRGRGGTDAGEGKPTAPEENPAPYTLLLRIYQRKGNQNGIIPSNFELVME